MLRRVSIRALVPVKPSSSEWVIVSTPDGGVMMARNFDFPYGTAMILHTTPDNGYESITTFSTDFFGFGENYKPEATFSEFHLHFYAVIHYLCILKELMTQ